MEVGTGQEERVVVVDLQTQVPGGSCPPQGQPRIRGVVKALEANTSFSFPNTSVPPQM